jgi:hypothetical protein
MLTGFFRISKPVNYLLVAIFMAFVFVAYAFKSGNFFLSVSDFFIQLVLLVLFLFSMLLVDFITRKNDLTRKNTFAIFFYAAFCGMFPDTFLRPDVFIAHFFILLALRRIISLKTKKDTQKKIFDAALWLAVASCFDFWAFAFILILYLNIIFEAGNNYKHYFIPFVSFGVVIILTNVFTLFFQDAFYLPLDWVGSSGFDFSYYNSLSVLVPLSFLLVLIVWMIGNFYSKINQRSKKNIRSTRLILFGILAALLIPVFSPQKNGSELIYLSFPFAVFTANFIELPEEKIFKEILLWVFLLLPFAIFFM